MQKPPFPFQSSHYFFRPPSKGPDFQEPRPPPPPLETEDELEKGDELVEEDEEEVLESEVLELLESRLLDEEVEEEV